MKPIFEFRKDLHIFRQEMLGFEVRTVNYDFHLRNELAYFDKHNMISSVEIDLTTVFGQAREHRNRGHIIVD
jgi:hypothetical protein